MKKYIEKMRSRMGREKFIHPGARIIVENEAGQILVEQRMGFVE